MSEIREQIAEELWNHECGHIDTKWSLLDPAYKLRFLDRAEQILSIPELAIVDRGAELPKPSLKTKSKAEPARGWTLAQDYAYLDAQQDMLKAGWVREIKE